MYQISSKAIVPSHINYHFGWLKSKNKKNGVQVYVRSCPERFPPKNGTHKNISRISG